ncbi:MAG: thermonuclease family protein [Bosea sp.]|uniref:thermonuclease family protein n=1 Tax=Bosea sp. (in: a-proteobacteria) TaxID=1871050 RepID=UPI001AD30DDE|nr:thermonuclease family protein [Bosea sp. (in: a-proteobacteria)]MBN9453853.1 thermonuclease family protein [Bosea sp. (in: a-proteobacteria)]
MDPLNSSRNFLFGAAVLLFCPAVSSAQSYEFRPGQAVAIDGDTLRIGSQRIRLSAMDAPELSQVCRSDAGKATLCGRDSRDALAKLIREGVRCMVETHDRYGREVATCTNAAGLDIGREMIRQGWAVPYWRYGGARYSKAYDEALAADVGMHAGTFIDPEQWRRGERW